MVFIEAIGDGTITTDNNNSTKQQQQEEKEDDDDVNRSCNVCGGKCTTRCSLCRLVYYCSVECQRTDWNEGGHKRTCKEKRSQTKKKKNKNSNIKPTIGPSLPPPSSVHNEQDAKRVLQELWSIQHTVASSSPMAENEPQTSKPYNPTPSVTTNASTLEEDCQQQQQKGENGSNSGAVTTTSAFAAEVVVSLPETTTENERMMPFVVEEMPQICRFQLTLTKQQTRHTKRSRVIKDTSISVSAEPLERSGSRTLVIVREKQNSGNVILFAGEFPRPIQASEITWRVVTENDNDDDNNRGGSNDDRNESDDNAASVVNSIVFRLPYPYDPSNTSSLALGGSLVTQHSSYGSSSSPTSTSTLDEVNRVMCGTCHLPLMINPGSSSSSSNKPQPQQTKKSSSQAAATPVATKIMTINRVFPLPQGHWDEIADYLICYDGQPVVDFSAGSECAEPSIALQDASLLCFHRRDVEAAVCALAVDGYGELTMEGSSNDNDVDNDDSNAASTSNGEDDLGTFFTKSPSSSFVLPNVATDPPPTEAAGTNTAAAATEEKKDDPDEGGANNNNEPPISASSAVVRGDRTWQDAADGDSVSLCCGRCCSPLGFASLGSPETWRFWKHRLSIQTTTTKAQTRRGKEIEEEKDESSSNNTAITMSFATAAVADTAATNTTKTNRPRKPFTLVVLPVTRPLGSCSSFLARELVRYAESKAIFTFVVRRDAEEKNDDGKCLLLRLLSWETAMATSFDDENEKISLSSSSSSKPSLRLRFTKVAKIVFEETTDPAAKAKGHSANHQDNGAPTQWFWGGVDLCCLPPSSGSGQPTATATSTSTANGTNNSTTIPNGFGSQEQKAVSTARLQLPKDEYDRVLKDLDFGRSLFEKEMADATILFKMDGIWKGLGLTAVALE